MKHQMGMETGARSRVAGYDLVRVMAAALVVLIHVMAPYAGSAGGRPGDAAFASAISEALRFAVPTFVLLTGALVWTRDPHGTGWRSFYIRRVRTLVVPYIAWSAIFLALRLSTLPATSDPPGEVLRGLVLGAHWYHLYFIPAILGVYAVAPVASAILKTHPHLLLAGACVVGIVVPIAVSREGLEGVVGFALLSLVCRFLPYAAVGAWYVSVRASAQTRAFERRYWIVALTLGIAMRWVQPEGDPLWTRYVIAAIYLVGNSCAALGLLWLARLVVDWDTRVATWSHRLAAATLGVYLGHPLLLHVLEPLLTRGLGGVPPLWIQVVMVWPAVTALSFALVGAAVRSGRLRWMHGTSSAVPERAGAPVG